MQSLESKTRNCDSERYKIVSSRGEKLVNRLEISYRVSSIHCLAVTNTEKAEFLLIPFHVSLWPLTFCLRSRTCMRIGPGICNILVFTLWRQNDPCFGRLLYMLRKINAVIIMHIILAKFPIRCVFNDSNYAVYAEVYAWVHYYCRNRGPWS